MRYFILLLTFLIVSCDDVAQEEDVKPPLVLKEASFEELPGWGEETFQNFVPAFQKSCTRILRGDPGKAFGALEQAGTFAAWQEACDAFSQTAESALKAFFEERFTPHAVLAGEEPEGLFTGYYEASLKGSRTKSGPYNIPLHTRPDDLVMVHLGQFREELKGHRIAGRVIDGTLKPYESRAEIVAGDWPHDDQILVWVDDPVDAFFVQIQGSGVVELAEGGTMRIGYAGQNGHPYYAIGRELIDRGELTKEAVSLQSIRAWLAANPDQADEIMNTNKSYVFFRELTGEGPVGGEGVALTPGRSLAIDRSLLSYGMPIWTDIEAPIEGAEKIQRLMITQDTGGAIRGPVRGDFFWGHGPEAEHLAGHMKSKGRYWVLLPKE